MSKFRQKQLRCVVMHLDGSGDELLNHPKPSSAEQVCPDHSCGSSAELEATNRPVRTSSL